MAYTVLTFNPLHMNENLDEHHIYITATFSCILLLQIVP